MIGEGGVTELAVSPGAPSNPTHEPAGKRAVSLRQNSISAAIPLTSRQHPILERLTLLIHPKRTELVINGHREANPTETRTTSTQPQDHLKSVAEQLSEPGFRITYYTTHSRGHDRIKVEIRSGRTDGKHAWKKAKTCDTAEEAIAYLHDAYRAYKTNGEEK